MIKKLEAVSPSQTCSLDIKSQSVFQRALAYRLPVISEVEFNNLTYEKQEQYLKSLRSQVFEIHQSQSRLDFASMHADFAITSFVISLESAIFNYAIQPLDSELVSYILNRAIHCCNFPILEDRIENLLDEISDQVSNDFQVRHIFNKYMQAGIKCADFQDILDSIRPDPIIELLAAIEPSDQQELSHIEETKDEKPSIIQQIRTQLIALLPDKN